MRSGKLDSLVTVQRRTATINEAGTPSEDWLDHATLRAEVIRLSTVEVIRNLGGAVDERTLTFRTRFMPGLTTADRIVFDGHVYNIKEVVPIGRNRSLELRAEAREAEG